MKKKHFYSHITAHESVVISLETLDLEAKEKTHLIELLEVNMHHTVFDAILSELSPEDKKLFLEHVAEDDHEKIWSFLNGKIENIEEKIKKAADALTEELHKDIKAVS